MENYAEDDFHVIPHAFWTKQFTSLWKDKNK